MDDTLSVEALTQLRFFEGESPDALEWLLDACKWRELADGEVLLAPEQTNDKLYVLVRGVLKIHLERDDPSIKTLHPGECAGEMSVLDDNPTSAWVVAEGSTRVMELDDDSVWALITHSHIVAVNLLTILSDRVRSDNRRLDRSQQLRSFYEHHAKVDSLTGLHNRRWLDRTLARLAKRAEGSDQPLSLIMIDADHFKNYNDTHGHPAGDRALHAIATAVLANVRPNDVAARYGGEEFVVLLPDTGLRKALDVAERLRESVMSSVIMADDGSRLPDVTVSVGVATASNGEPVTALLAASDAALYRSKQLGRNRVSS